jgi:hypothetical protein
VKRNSSPARLGPSRLSRDKKFKRTTPIHFININSQKRKADPSLSDDMDDNIEEFVAPANQHSLSGVSAIRNSDTVAETDRELLLLYEQHM